MKYFFLFFLLLSADTAFAKLKVFTTTTNLADVVRQVGGELVEVKSLCKGVQDPHYLEAKPSYALELSKADLLISVGADLEVGWLPLVVRSSRNPKIREGQRGRLVAANTVELMEKDPENISRSQGDVHPDGNPHFMLSPQKSVEVAYAISKKLSELDKPNQAKYESRFKTYKSKINKLIKKLRQKIKPGMKVISYHKTLTYFYHDFGIKNIGFLEPKPGIPPTASHILKILKKMKTQSVEKILVENYFDDKVARRIQNEMPKVKIETIPVAVGGKKGVSDVFSLYEYLATQVSR